MRNLSLCLAAVWLLGFAGVRALGWPVTTNSFRVNLNDLRPERLQLQQGEQRVFEFVLSPTVSVSGMEVDYLYRTPGMAEWYTVGGESSTNLARVWVNWSPTNDIGAPRYLGWVRIKPEGGAPLYRIQLDLAMIETPGFIAGEAVLYYDPIDFDSLTWTNEPWATPAEVAAAETNAQDYADTVSDAAEVAAKSYADGLDAAMDTRVQVVEGFGDHGEAGYLTEESDEIALAALEDFAGSVTNTFLRVYEESPGVWKHLLPGETAP